jgi:hypothetical protein
MSLDQYSEAAIKYRVEDLPSALRPGTPVSNVLRDLELGEKPISDITQQYLRRLGLLMLLRYARGEVSFAEYLKGAQREQSERRIAAKTEALAAEAKAFQERAEKKSRDEAMQAKLVLMGIQAAAKKNLRKKYSLSHFIEKADFPTLMTILRRVDNGIRLSEDEIVWLSTEGKDYFTDELRKGFHQIEAFFHASEFKKNKEPWSAVNASRHYRKCGRARSADSMLSTIDVSILKDSKLKSAIYTTHGGVKRDLKEWEEALCLGEQAHQLTPKDFRPCTLLGAVNMETGHYDLGRSWYAKAVERGFNEESVDDEFRHILFRRIENSERETLRNYLLTIDPERYGWARKKVSQKAAGGKNHRSGHHH